jgi:hypothetical protein
MLAFSKFMQDAVLIFSTIKTILTSWKTKAIIFKSKALYKKLLHLQKNFFKLWISLIRLGRHTQQPLMILHLVHIPSAKFSLERMDQILEN